MLFPRRLCFVLTWGLLLIPSTLSAQLTRPLTGCHVDGLEEPVLCGSLRVPEDPARSTGRQIDLHVVVLPTRNPPAKAEPVAVLPGGPGQSGVALAGFAARVFDALREDRDILLVDPRGTGGSNPLDCPGFSSSPGPAAYTGPLFPPRLVRQCRRSLGDEADLAQYTTTRVADDMVRVWRALGYRRVDVYGTSYGTRVALVIMRRHPGSVRAAVLKGVAPLSLTMPLNYPRDSQRSLDLVFDACRSDPDCAGAYPRPEADFSQVLKALEEGVAVRLRHPVSGDTATVRLTRPTVTAALIGLLQSPALAVRLPRMIHLASQGSWEPLGSLTLFYRVSVAKELYEGMFLSVTCAEDLPFIDPEQAAREARGTFLGLARYKDQKAACAAWDVPAVEPDFRTPVSVPVPTLLISGRFDPVTPPRWAGRVAERSPEAFSLVVPGGGHSFSGMMDCVEGVIARFFRVARPPTAVPPCVDRTSPGPFALPGDPWLPMVQPPGG